MQVQNTKGVSFQQFRIDAKGTKALTDIILITQNDAIPELKSMLRDFKSQCDTFAKRLNENEITKGTDIVLTQVKDDATGWTTVPALLMQKEEYQVNATRLYLHELVPNPSKSDVVAKLNVPNIKSRAADLKSNIQDWFNSNFTRLVGLKKAESQRPEDILKEIFV